MKKEELKTSELLLIVTSLRQLENKKRREGKEEEEEMIESFNYYYRVEDWLSCAYIKFELTKKLNPYFRNKTLKELYNEFNNYKIEHSILD